VRAHRGRTGGPARAPCAADSGRVCACVWGGVRAAGSNSIGVSCLLLPPNTNPRTPTCTHTINPPTPPPPRPPRYVWLSANSAFKSESDLLKYEKARKLKDYIVDIRRQYTRDWSSSDMRKKQVGGCGCVGGVGGTGVYMCVCVCCGGGVFEEERARVFWERGWLEEGGENAVGGPPRRGRGGADVWGEAGGCTGDLWNQPPSRPSNPINNNP